MKWITKIDIDNYKAFPTVIQPIVIKPLNHLLIYGENGSGKSSVYKAVRDFLRSSNNNLFPFELNMFSKISGNSNGSVKLEISDINFDVDGKPQSTAASYLFSSNSVNSTNSIAFFQMANKLNGFFDYKAMLKTHFINVRDGVNPNIFNFLIKEILSASQIPDPSGGAGTVELFATYERISNDILKNAITTNKYQTAIVELASLNLYLKRLLQDVFGLVNIYFKDYFEDPKITIDLNISEIELFTVIRGKKRLKEEIFFKVFYAGTELPFYHAFLNEARLSALAISIFFASIKVYPLQVVDLRVIYLDDVFIGLDNSNRIPLLKLLKKEFSDDNFQIIISSYDKEWFELVKLWFSTENMKYKAVEMYFDRDDDPTTPDRTVIINAQTNYQKADDNFKKKEYAAAGYYLRKECEYLIKSLLPDTFKTTIEGSEITELEGLLQKLLEYYIACGLHSPQELINAIKIYRKLVLNPSSHADLKCPIYRNEVLEAFKMVGELKSLPKIERIKLLDKGQILEFINQAPAYKIELELAEHLYRINNGDTVSYTLSQYYIKKWEFEGVEFGGYKGGNIEKLGQGQIDNSLSQKRNLDEIFRGINHSTRIAIPADLEAAVLIRPSGSLKDLLTL